MTTTQATAANSSASTLIFVHIPKAAGMTLRHIVARQYLGQPMYMFNQINSYAVEPFLALPEAERARLAYISGHVRYGIHRYVGRPARYITLVRDPVEHLVSSFFFFSKEKNRTPDKALATFERYLRRSEVPSIQLDWLVGYDLAPNPETGLIDNSANQRLPTADKLALAEQHLREHFAVVGLVEEFDTSLLLMQRALGWGNIGYVLKHHNDARPRGADLADFRALVEQYAQPDLQCYSLARSIFAEQCRAYGETLAADVAKFQHYNHRFSQLSQATRRLRETGIYRRLRRLGARLKTGRS